MACGDLNVAHQEIDLEESRPQSGQHRILRRGAGELHPPVRRRLHRYLPALYPDLTGAYSWWSYRFNARKNNAGWRIDYFLVSNALRNRVSQARIHGEILGSDHCPVELELNWEASTP